MAIQVRVVMVGCKLDSFRFFILGLGWEFFFFLSESWMLRHAGERRGFFL
jgi:hypothetical protein